MWKSKFYGAFVLNRLDGDAGSSPLDRARTAASSPGNKLVKNCRAPDALVDFHTGREAFQRRSERFFAICRSWVCFFCPEQLVLFSFTAHELVGLSVADEYEDCECRDIGRDYVKQAHARARVDLYSTVDGWSDAVSIIRLW